uniref:Lipocalin n=1 Tax=Rhipicephalus appendiculatus TaxID=34631 RepID=A0A131Z6V6_RHIAP
MCLWVVFSVLYLPTAVLAVSAESSDYDYYEEEGQETTHLYQATKEPPTKVQAILDPDISEFYSTNEKVWVYSTTKRSKEICTVDDVNHTTLINVFLTRYSFLNGTIQSISIEAKFGVHPNPIISPKKHIYNELELRIEAITSLRRHMALHHMATSTVAGPRGTGDAESTAFRSRGQS